MSIKRLFDFKTVGVWYNGGNFADAHLVTDENHNKNLTIENIILLEPRTKADNNIVAIASVVMSQLTFEATIYLAKNGVDLTAQVESRKYVDSNGKDQWTPVFRPSQAVMAQILRHAESRRLAEPVAWESDIPAMNATNNEATNMFSGMTPEQIAQMITIMNAGKATETTVNNQQAVNTSTAQGTDGFKLPEGFNKK